MAPIVVQWNLSSFEKIDLLYKQWLIQYSSVLILSTRLSAKSLRANFDDVDSKKLQIIDCVSDHKPKKLQLGSDIYVTGLSSLGPMTDSVHALLSKNKIDLLVIDSLSTLIGRHDYVSILHFANAFVKQARTKRFSIFMPILEKDATKELAAIQLYVDRIEKT